LVNYLAHIVAVTAVSAWSPRQWAALAHEIALIINDNHALKARVTTAGQSEAFCLECKRSHISDQFGFVVTVMARDGFPYARHSVNESASCSEPMLLN